METRDIPSSSFPRRRESHRYGTKLGWFTLVELIVVITILVILGTIAFLNLGNFSSGARDSGRISDLANISKGLDLMYIKNGVVLPPESGTNAGVVNLYASWVLIGQQGAIGTTLLSAIKMGGDGKDPVDKKSYTYLVNADKTKYQLLALAEDSSSVIGLNATDRAYAGYEGRYPMAKGSSLGVLLGSTGVTLNQPIQENYSASTFTGVEIFTATGGLYTAVISSKSTLSGTGAALWAMVANLDASAGAYPGCDTPNIRLPNGQMWAACNVGASKAYRGEKITNCNGWGSDCNANLRYTIGSYFQWGRNTDVTAGAKTAGPIASNSTSSFITNSASPYDWISLQDDNLWGWSGTTAVGWTYASQWSPATMQWPCANGYHVPTIYEWCLAIKSINPSISCTTSYWSDSLVTSILNLPLAGYRNNSVGGYSFASVAGDYLSSSPSGTSAFGIDIQWGTQILPLYSNIYRAVGFSLRCLKN